MVCEGAWSAYADRRVGAYIVLSILYALVGLGYIVHLTFIIIKRQRNVLPLCLYGFLILFCISRATLFSIFSEDTYTLSSDEHGNLGVVERTALWITPEVPLQCAFILQIAVWATVAHAARFRHPVKLLYILIFCIVNCSLVVIAYGSALIAAGTIPPGDSTLDYNEKAYDVSRIYRLVSYCYLLVAALISGGFFVWQLRKASIISLRLQICARALFCTILITMITIILKLISFELSETIAKALGETCTLSPSGMVAVVFFRWFVTEVLPVSILLCTLIYYFWGKFKAAGNATENTSSHLYESLLQSDSMGGPGIPLRSDEDLSSSLDPADEHDVDHDPEKGRNQRSFSQLKPV